MSIAAAALISIALCAAMLLALEAGYRIARKREEPAQDGVGLFQTAIFALLGLLLGFSFAGSMGRFEARRDLIIREANAISAAYFRIDVLPPAFQPEMRNLFHSYLEARLHAYDDLDSGHDFESAMAKASLLQQQIWAKAVEATSQDTSSRTLVLSSLNEMIGVTTARAVAWQTNLPTVILVLLLCVALLTSLLAGYGMAKSARRHVFHGVIYAAAVSLTIYVVLDLDNPRRGLIRLDSAEQVLRQLQRAI
jgi:hypothetical protein